MGDMIYLVPIIIAIIGGCINMIYDDTMDRSAGLVIFFVGAFALGLMISGDFIYKKGQIDAINGKIKYELKTNSDSTRTWESIKK